MQLIFRLIEQAGFPAGVINLVNGAKACVDAILEHPIIKAVTFVGSSPVARYIYKKAAENGKRVQAQGGAKNPVVILPDADIDMATKIVADSAFGCAGQRCLAVSWAVTVGEDILRLEESHPALVDVLPEDVRAKVRAFGL